MPIFGPMFVRSGSHWLSMQIRPCIFSVVLAALAPLSATAQEPLSAIDWLELQVSVPVVSASPNTYLGETPVSNSVLVPDISVQSLTQSVPDSVGLLPSNVTGLPNTLWSNSNTNTVVALITRQNVAEYPALQALLYTLLLAEVEPPQDAGQTAALLLARIDKLIEMGAVDQAAALIERAGIDTPALFSRWFNVSLLTGGEDVACRALAVNPHLSAEYATRVFCTARNGDWDTAALTLDTARALRLISSTEEALLSRFLDLDDAPMLSATLGGTAPTPLVVRLYEAIGEPLPTAPLPRAFAMIDLRNTSGWKAELEAAERLARVGALPENHLLGIYTTRQPAASGGVWDRVRAIQRLDIALQSGAAEQVAKALPQAWGAAKEAQLEVPFARLFAQSLMAMKLPEDVSKVAFRIAILSPYYEQASKSFAPVSQGDRFLASLAAGAPQAELADETVSRAVARAFDGARPPENLARLLSEGRLGEVILQAMALFSRAAAGDPQNITDALATFRAVGLEFTARQAAIQLLVLERGV